MQRRGIFVVGVNIVVAVIMIAVGGQHCRLVSLRDLDAFPRRFCSFSHLASCRSARACSSFLPLPSKSRNLPKA
ncbi:hypothetical protein BKA70DRAFT_1270760 [Coprinopsis sp. MPI-PUGE-AT-0042]|nr:hypothetical protein BKA70DRAFT_1270760 [Coprinopsis sp. MPI-PUGE-AT-0042]